MTPTTDAADEKPESNVAYATLRDALDHEGFDVIHVACSFDDGQKLSLISVNAKFPNLARRIKRMLCDDALAAAVVAAARAVDAAARCMDEPEPGLLVPQAEMDALRAALRAMDGTGVGDGSKT